MSGFLHSKAAKIRFIKQALALMVRRSADGANFDFEPMPQSLSLDYAKFLAQFKAAMLKQFPRAKLVVATSAGAPYTLIDGIENIVDQMLVMTYNYRWSGSTVTGAIAPLDNTTRTVKLHIERYLKHVAASKMILGVPYYGYDWPVTADDAECDGQQARLQVRRRVERDLQLGSQVPRCPPRGGPPRGHRRGQRLLHLLGRDRDDVSARSTSRTSSARPPSTTTRSPTASPGWASGRSTTTAATPR